MNCCTHTIRELGKLWQGKHAEIEERSRVDAGRACWQGIKRPRQSYSGQNVVSEATSRISYLLLSKQFITQKLTDNWLNRNIDCDSNGSVRLKSANTAMAVTKDGSAFQNFQALNFVTNKGALNDVINKLEITRAELAPGFIVIRQGRIRSIVINGYTASNPVANGFCTVGDVDKPAYNTTFAVNVEGTGIGTVVLNTSGQGTLYNSTMGGYLGGTVRGTVTYFVP